MKIILIFLILINSCILNACSETHIFITPSEWKNGFVLTGSNPTTDSHILGEITFPHALSNSSKPIWRVDQWGSQIVLLPGQFQSVQKKWVIENKAKKIELIKENQYFHLVLRCNGITEYQGKLREIGEPWPHLLIEKIFYPEINVGDYKLTFEIEFKINYCNRDEHLSGKIDPKIHTAQTTAYWTVKNVNPSSPNYKDYFWFGIPLFDVRYTIPPEYYSVDKGSPYSTNKFIAVVDGHRIWKENTGDGKWKSLQIEINPLIDEALQKGKEQNYLVSSHIEELSLTSFNLGWEITGPYDAEMEVRKLELWGIQNGGKAKPDCETSTSE